MKEILAIIRADRMEATKTALESAGIRGVTFISATGRGRQRGTIQTPDREGTLRRDVGVYLMRQRNILADPDDPRHHRPVEKEIVLGFLPKKVLMIAAPDEEAARIADTIIRVNRSGQPGDGKIFICPLDTAVRISSGESGNKALI